ncbi:hypothetical protein Goarm_004864 [Gossypium armourianum]|uniref:RNase H type-1 domain-containing protein n=1 Tax=Gossypium armourianum TaxID=34283 RepID=A0A7J9JY39_9ROSI|nr:hypothetical protein [Gossypium armourianum]
MEYWGYAFCCAVHLINRLPTSVLKGQTPYRALYEKDPTYDYLRIFGYYCFPYLRLFLHHKLEFRSQPCTFLGYSSQHKGYQCHMSDGKVVISHHVVFDEQRFLSPSSATKGIMSSSGTIATFVPLVKRVAASTSPIGSSPSLSLSDTFPVEVGSAHETHSSSSLPTDDSFSGPTVLTTSSPLSPPLPSSSLPQTNTHMMKVADGSIIVGEVPSCEQVADIITKPLSVSYFDRFRGLLRVLPLGKLQALPCVHAIRFRAKLGFLRSAIEGDALSVIKKIQSEEDERSEIRAYILDAKRLKSYFISCRFRHAWRQMNKVAHLLAKRTQYGRRYLSEERPS